MRLDGDIAVYGFHDDENLLVYPNPTSGNASVAFIPSTDTHASVDVYNVKGQHLTTLFSSDVTAGSAYETEVNSSEWQAGVYVIRFTADGKTTYRKLIVINK